MQNHSGVLDRLLRYVRIDTQSDPASATVPSTEKQKNLGRLLVEELKAMGLEDAELDPYGYVYATLPGNTEKDVPVLCLCAHMDTSPDASGKDVKPIVHSNWDGRPIVLPDDPRVVLRVDDHPHLADQVGNDIVTASGTTLLGADNKAGLAEIMTAVEYLITHPELKRGKVRILFTPDEEIGRGVDKVDIEKLGADYGYTVDGERRGSLDDETFSADAATLVIRGVSAHPGFAKGNMESAIKIAGEVLARLPKDRLSPESTEGREGFIHPVQVEGNVETATISFIVRDFDTQKLQDHAAELEGVVQEVLKAYPRSSYVLNLEEQYRNMKEVLQHHPHVAQYAAEAMRRAGLTVHKSSIRGGTDGSRLSFMGLPCPNIFAGEYAFHSKQEWTSVQDMQAAVDTLIHLVRIWEEKAD